MDYYWQIKDGRIWSSAAAAFVDETPEGITRIPLYADGEPAGVDYLRETIVFYGCGLGELKSAAEMQKEFTDAIQARLDGFAQSRGYDGILSMATYATSKVPQFAAEGQQAVEMRDATWSAAAKILADVSEGKRPPPAWAEVEEELPGLVWPGDEEERTAV